MKEIGIIHCDLKPENILFTSASCERVKIIDFGSACTDFKAGFSYVQSRFYRSPEVVLGLPYNHAVDMWSFGCIIAELITGTPLFPALNEKELLEFFIIRIGLPPPDMVEQCRKRKIFFDSNGKLIKSRVSRIPYNSEPRSDSIRRTLHREKDDSLIDFIEVSRIEFDT